jgi:hypothetical protein
MPYSSTVILHTTTGISGWQVFAAGATALGTLVALAVAVWTVIQRRRDEIRAAQANESRALAQARLVGVGCGNPGGRMGNSVRPGFTMPQWELTFGEFINRSDHPVLDVYAEVWTPDQNLDEPPHAVHQEMLVPDEPLPLFLSFPTPVQGLRAWRLRWTDHDGKQWCRDQYPQRTPLPFTGQPPRSYNAAPDPVS